MNGKGRNGENGPEEPSRLSIRTTRSIVDEPYAVGSAVHRSDAFDKVIGREKYAADYYGEDLLWAGARRAGIPHARLKDISVEEAVRLPGVVTVLTHAHVGGTNRQGVVQKDQPVLVDDKVRHCGDALALVLAEDRTTLKTALDAIRIDAEEIPGVFDAETALEPGSPLVHEGRAEGNVLLSDRYVTGKGASGLEDCDVVVEACFKTARQEHAFLETECGWARVGEDGRLVIVCSTQTPFRDRMEVSESLGLSPETVRIVAPYPGGAFGGKDGVTVQTLLGLAAIHADGRPVKMWWDREESFLAGTKRHAARMYYRLGAKSDGSLHCLDVRIYLDTGPYDHLGGVVLALAMEHAGGAYRIPNVCIQGWCVYTNNSIGGAFRGFGVTQVTAAIEQMVDMAAERLQVGPVDIRKKNGVRRGDKNCIGVTLVHSTGLGDCLESLGKHPMWLGRNSWKAEAGLFKRRGVGIAALVHGSGYGPVVPDVANAKIELSREGKFTVFSGIVDMGQGNASTNLQIAGSILGQGPSAMELVLPDTDLTLPSGSASASRCTYTFGNALVGAAEIIKKRILQRAADLLMAASESEIALIRDGIRHLPSGKEISLASVASFMGDAERTAVYRYRAPICGEQPNVGPALRLHGFPHTLFSYAVHMASVEVDELTGEITVCGYLAVNDCGTVMNPQTYAQQVEGGIGQGIGYALMEDLGLREGRVMTPDFGTYVIPTAVDVPDIDTLAVELYEETGPYGLKGIGEIATNGPLPAVSNAVRDAIGSRVFEYPLTPERILDALNSSKTGARP